MSLNCDKWKTDSVKKAITHAQVSLVISCKASGQSYAKLLRSAEMFLMEEVYGRDGFVVLHDNRTQFKAFSQLSEVVPNGTKVHE